MPCSRGLSSNTVALGFSTISPMHIDMKMCRTVVLADSFCWCFFLYLRVCVFLCFVPAYTCFSTGSFDALVFVLLKVPELKKLVVAKVWLEIALRVLKGSSFVEAYNPNSPRVSRLFEEQHDRKVAAAFNRHLSPLSSAHRSRQAAPLSAHKLLGKLGDAPSWYIWQNPLQGSWCQSPVKLYFRLTEKIERKDKEMHIHVPSCSIHCGPVTRTQHGHDGAGKSPPHTWAQTALHSLSMQSNASTLLGWGKPFDTVRRSL